MPALARSYLLLTRKVTTVNSELSRQFNFRETSHMRSFVKIKPSRIGDITQSFTDIGKSYSVRNFLRRKFVFERYSRK